MKEKNKNEAVDYTLGVTGFSIVIALFKSITQSKVLTVMVMLGIVGVSTFLYVLFQHA